jgi:serine/threonine protein phosphatase PrpC
LGPVTGWVRDKVSPLSRKILIQDLTHMRIRPGLERAALTDVGCQRENNEDRFSYWEPDNEEDFRAKGRLVIVADGMGGYEGGQEASRLAVEAIESAYSDGKGADPQSSLVNAFSAAHARILQEAQLRPDLHGMGTTCTAAALVGRNLYYAHVGDSRLYLVRSANISRLSHDHSYVSRLVEQGVISPEQAEHHPQRHVLTAALGAGHDIAPDFPSEPVNLQHGDILVLCTDGLWSMMRDEEIQAAVHLDSLAEACEDLVQTAKQRGGPDNITVQILRICDNGSR